MAMLPAQANGVSKEMDVGRVANIDQCLHFFSLCWNISMVICSDTKPIKKMTTAVVNNKALMLVNRPEVIYVKA